MKSTSKKDLATSVDKLFLGIFSKKVHKDLLGFLEKFIPSLLPREPKNDGGTWTAVPPPLKFPTHSHVAHSFIFTKHSYLKLKFDRASINISHTIYDDPNWFDSNFEFDLEFLFRTRKAAYEFYKSINEQLSQFNVDKKVFKYKGFLKTAYFDEKSEKYYNGIEIMLAKNLLSQKLAMQPTKKGPRFIIVYDYVVKMKLPKI